MRRDDEHVSFKTVPHQPTSRFNHSLPIVMVTELDRMIDELRKRRRNPALCGAGLA